MATDGKLASISGKCQVDLQCAANNKAHRTIEISEKRLLLRRGQSFDIKVFFKDGFNLQKHMIELAVVTGPDPKKSEGSKIVISFAEELNVKRWSAVINSVTKNELSLTITSSPRAIIGRYSLSLQHDYMDISYFLGNFVLLFNPWCAGDEVYLNSDVQRKEYVLNETGTIYYGGSDYIGERDWNFGQFEEDILDICLNLLDNAPKYLKKPRHQHLRRCFSVQVARTVSAMVNSANDQGVLQGRWSSPYSGGVYPGKWNGSIAILRQWQKSNFKPVRYGQCWVFAAVTCTVLRCLGIPTRVVTNFDSAHDTDANLTIDNYYNVEGDDIGGSSDSVWNFHVWNESWMARNDLDPGYDGWQVVDATPQEESDGTYCCGPASVKAIKGGDLDHKYDAPFVFAEVNAKRVNWLLFADGTKMKMDVDVLNVGHCVSTKKCGKDEREDITHLYKYPDGSTEEEEIFKKAKISIDEPALEKTLKVSLKVSQPIYLGQTVSVSVVVSNKSSEEKVCTVNFWAKKKMYQGNTEKGNIKTFKKEITIPAAEDKSIPLELSYKDYGTFPDMYYRMRLITYVTDKLPENNVATIKDIGLLNPPLTIKMQNFNAYVGEKTHVEISFKNPFALPLKNCVMSIEGNGLVEDEKSVQFDDVKPNALAKVTCDFTPKKPGERKLLVDIDCDLMQNLKGSLKIDVQKKK